MTESDSSEKEDHNYGDGTPARRNSSWGVVDPRIWARNRGGQGLFRRPVRGLGRRILAVFSSTEFLVFVLAPTGGLSIYLTFFLAYSLGGVGLFGVYLIGLWAVLILVAVVVLEKTGYARNFEAWDFPLRRILVLPVGFGLAAGLILLMVYLAGAFH